MLMDLAKRIMEERYVCNHCLGRQFAQLLSGMTNEKRGEAIRTALAMEYGLKPFSIEMGNFHGYDFRSRKIVPASPGKCAVCDNVFDRLQKFSAEALQKLEGIEFRSLMAGTNMPGGLVAREESLWEETGIEYCEPLKSEINREFGKMLLSALEGKEFDESKPDVVVMLDIDKGRANILINPLFLFGSYRKLVRGIPQTKWEMYKETVEDIIAAPLMKQTGGRSHSMHAMGREDIDARCLDWRPFVFEIERPLKRNVDLKAAEKSIAKTRKVEVSGLRFSSRKEAVRVKSLQPDKTYRALVVFEKPVESMAAVRKIKSVRQQTPTRVLHRRADKTRIKHVRSIIARKLSPRKYEFIIKGQAGLYIKELIHGDAGRTRPSIAEALGVPAKVKQLDVIRIHVKASDMNKAE